METQDIKDLVEEVLGKFSPPYPPDITDQVCLAIEQNPAWLRRYEELNGIHKKDVVNNSIGWYTIRLTGMKNSGKVERAKSKLIKTYSRLGD
ncbi:MAG: hypothetical protein JXB47_20010 [Anaerolineae bacterium]|nr:hypothetical protein [Anaerolineae bacterium]